MAIWLDIKDAPGYEVSSDGWVRNAKTGRVLKTHLNRKGGYARVNIGGKHRYVHKLVADRFYEDTGEATIIRHVDGNIMNNHVSNLQKVSLNRCTDAKNV
ncbi:MAG: hypothetical protein IKL08_06100 [Clostridia bacterium]|nr:hypothetical protein [Clostridia bacterium]